MKEAELRRCQIQEWYPKFRPYTIKTFFHPLPAPFVRYLLGQPVHSTANSSEDTAPFLLPLSISGTDPLPRVLPHLLNPISSLSFVDSDDDENCSGCGADPEVGPPSFPDLEAAIDRSIADLGSSAFPKLNWSAPKDAAWISPDGTLRCTSLQDIALLLRSSDAIVHDLCHALPSCSDHVSVSEEFSTPFFLALRKWYPFLRPEMEFRCFVRRRELVGISQREVTTFYPDLLDRRREIQPLIEFFFDEIILPRFESEDYTFDVYVTSDQRVKVLDFNPWGAFTLPLMFEWEEMETEGFRGSRAEFRVVEERCGVRPGLKSAVPYDYLDTGKGSGWDQFLRKAEEELIRQQRIEENAS